MNPSPPRASNDLTTSPESLPTPEPLLLTRLRHEGTALLFAAFFGLVVTVLVAWLCQIRSSVSIVDVDPTGGRRDWPSKFQASINAPGYWHASRGFGRSGELYAAFGGSSRSMQNEMVFIQSAGWPMRALEMVRWTDPTTNKEVSEHSVTLPQTVYLPDWVAGQPVPALPVWPGIVIDILAFGVIGWGLVKGLRWCRGRLRHWRGRCAGCGYPRGTGEVCVECGRALGNSPELSG